MLVVVVAGAVGRLVMVVGIAVMMLPFTFVRMSKPRMMVVSRDGRRNAVITRQSSG